MPAIPDLTYKTDIPDNTSVAIFNTANSGAFADATLLDAVGPVSETNPLFKRGTGYTPVSPGSAEWTFFRDLSSGAPKNSSNNAADFIFVSTDGQNYGAGARLGAPGPENLYSPIQMNGTL